MEATKQRHERALLNIDKAISYISIIESAQEKQAELLQSIKTKIMMSLDTTLNQAQRQSVLDAIDALRMEVQAVNEMPIWSQSHYMLNVEEYSQSSMKDSEYNRITFKVGSGTSSTDSYQVESDAISIHLNTAVDRYDDPDFVFASTSVSPDSSDLTKIDNLIKESISHVQSSGTHIERLEHKKDMLRAQINANEAVKSNYEDADFAKEQMELMKVQILQQTATAALAQANAAPQSVLSLFR